SKDELVAHDKVRDLFQKELDRFNANLDRQEKIRRFALLPRDFTIDADEITPSLKVKRKVIDKKYKDVIDQLYIDENMDDEREAKEDTRFGQQTIHRFSKLRAVTVAAINGVCLGGGCEIALACDWRVMTDDPSAKIGLPEVRLGIFPAWGGTTRLPRLIGLPAALDMILNYKQIDGKRAKRLGLIDEVAPSSIL